MIDTHCHLTFEGLRHRVDEVIAGAAADGVDRMISVGTTPQGTERAIEIAASHPNVFATAGVHPLYADRLPEGLSASAAVQTLRGLASHPKVVALGEMGLDRHHAEPAIHTQAPVFERQLELLAEMPGMPAIIHNREATDDTLARIRESGVAGDRFVFHCFAGSGEEVDAILDLGAMVSFTGIVTFKNARGLAEVSDRVPLERLMIETDAPFLTPAPHRKVRPNEPRYVAAVARFLAERRGMAMEDFTAATDANAQRFFNLPARK